MVRAVKSTTFGILQEECEGMRRQGHQGGSVYFLKGSIEPNDGGLHSSLHRMGKRDENKDTSRRLIRLESGGDDLHISRGQLLDRKQTQVST